MRQHLTVDPTASMLAVRTRAQGLLARLAHDLQLETHELRGQVALDGDAWTADLLFAPSSLHVAGALRGDELDRAALSPGDRAEIEKRMLADVFVPGYEVEAQAEGTSRTAGEATLAVGRAIERVKLTVSGVEEREGGGMLVRGRGEVSLKGLGAKAIKGPMGAFSVKDAVEVLFEVVLRPA